MSAQLSSSQAVLYSYWRSSCSYRVRIVLNLKEIPYIMRTIDILSPDGGEQHNREYRTVNPLEKIPALLIGE